MHALTGLENQLRQAAAPRPPDFKGSKLNQARRRINLEHWYYSQTCWARKRISQPDRDRSALGTFHSWIVAARAEAAAVAHVAKAQSTLQHKRKTHYAKAIQST